MIGFSLKKTLYDTWDNLFRMVMLNLGFVASAALPALLPTLLAPVPLLAVIVAILGVLWCFIYLAASALVLKELPDSGQFGFLDFARALKTAVPSGLVLGAAVLILGFVSYTSAKYYAGINTFAGSLAVGLIFWFTLVFFLGLQFFLPVRARFETDLRVVLKKSFLLLLDNLPFALVCALISVIMLVISLFTAFLFPGPAVALSFMDQALRLRMRKYDYLKANPEANRRKIPWDELLQADRDQTGKRSIKSFIYPWKD